MGRQNLGLVVEALFPRFCFSCGVEGSLLCDACLAAFEPGAQPPFAYANPVIRQLITSWKYKYDVTAWEKLQRLLAPRLQRLGNLLKEKHISAITFIPLSAFRARERGFNQAEDLAHWLGQQFNLPVVNLLRRKEGAGHQAEKSMEERQEILKLNLFLLREGIPLPASVLLVDDVLTTGSTMESAKEILLKEAVTEVATFTIAVG